MVHLKAFVQRKNIFQATYYFGFSWHFDILNVHEEKKPTKTPVPLKTKYLLVNDKCYEFILMLEETAESLSEA